MGILCPVFSINYDDEFAKIDELMQKSMLRDADTIIKRVEKESAKENNTREMLRSEIYSFAIDMGCIRSPKLGLGLLYSYDNKENGLDIINTHYNKTKKLLDKINDNVERCVCRYFLLMLANEYNKINETNHSSEIHENYDTLNLEDMTSKEIELVIQKLFSQLLNEFDALGIAKTSSYPQLFVNQCDKNSYVIESIGNAFAESIYLPSYAKCKKINSISSQLAVSKKDDARDSIYTKLVNIFMKYGCDSNVVTYDILRINNLRKDDEISNESTINALDALIQKYPNNTNIVDAEYLRDKLVYEKFDNKPITSKDKEEISELMERINNVKARFKDKHLTDRLNEISDKLSQHILYAKVKNSIHSGESVKLIVSNANVDKIKVKIHKTTTPAYSYFSRYNIRKMSETFKLSKSVFTYQAKDTFDLGTFDYGAYRIEIYDTDNAKKKKHLYFKVTDMAVMRDMLIYNNIYDFDRLGAPSKYVDRKYTPNVSFFEADKEIDKDNNIVHKFNIYALDSKTGKPIEGVKVKPIYFYDYRNDHKRISSNVIDKTGTDKNGKTVVSVPEYIDDEEDDDYDDYYNNNFSALCYISKGKDRYSADCRLNYNKNSDNSTRSYTNLFTDRAVYRPGQTVHYFGVHYTNSALGDFVETNKKVYIGIKKDKNIIIDSTTTDKFGKFYGDFKIHDSEDAIGEYSIIYESKKEDIKSYSWSNVHFNVEAYKLQQAEIEFYPLTEKNTLKPDVEFKGVAKYLSGEPLSNNTIHINIDTLDIDVVADSTGEFSIVYHPDTEKEYIYIDLNATITTPSGETIKKGHSYKLRKDNIFLSLNHDDIYKNTCYEYDDNIHKDKVLDVKNDKLIFNCTNDYNYKESPMPLKRNVKLVFQNKKDSIIYSEDYILNGITSVDIPNIAIGKYRIIAIDNEDGDTLGKWNAILFNPDINTNPCDDVFWASKESDYFSLAKNDSFDVSLGIGVDDAYVLFRIYNNYGYPLKEEWLNIKKGVKHIKIPYNELFSNEYRLGAIVTFNMYYDGVAYSRTYSIERKKEPKTIDVKISSLRDRIDAGSHQKWTIETDRVNMPSSVAVTMTDAALDSYKANSWNYKFNTYQPVFKVGSYCSSITYCTNRVSTIIPPYAKNEQNYAPYYSTLLCGQNIGSIDKNLTGEFIGENFKKGVIVKGVVSDKSEPLPFANVVIKDTEIGTNTDMDGNYIIIAPIGSVLEFSYSGYESKQYKIKDNQILNVVLEEDMLEELVVTGYGVQVYGGVQTNLYGTNTFSGIPRRGKTKEENSIEEVVNNKQPQQHKLRSNFSECAFFFPNIETKDGKATFEFDAPESLTRWNIKLFANTQDLYSGYANLSICTSIPFSVRPLLPRLLRSGDRQTISVSVINYENEATVGKVSFIVEDTVSKKEICKITKDFNVLSKGTQTIDFSFVVPDSITSVKITTVAESDKFSDGEVHPINVVSNRSRVIKANNAIIRKGEEKTLSVNAEKSDNIKLTFEYYPNSVWQAIMAMPNDKDLNEKNAIDMSTSLYINSIARLISINHPEIKNVIDKWMSYATTVNSPLYKHQDKSIVSLDATPWKYEAQEEKERHIQVANMLNSVNAEKRIKESLDNLKKHQNSNGGFCWWSDGPSSEWATLYVAMTLNRIRNIKGNNLNNNDILERSLMFIDKCIHDNLKYYQLRKSQNNSSVYLSTSEADLRELHLRLTTQDVLPISKNAKTAINVYLKDLSQNWKGLSLYGKACMVRCLVAAKKDSLAKVIATAIHQGYSKNPDQGIYWKDNVDYCSWHNNAIAVHAEAMRALKETNMVTDEEFAEMQLWLLHKRETTSWKSNTATADAIDILVNTMSSNISNGSVTMPDGEVINSESADGGYIRRTLNGKAGDNSVKINGVSDGIGFATLFASFNSDNDKITSASNHISISKKTFKVNRDSANKEILTEVKPNEELHIGDELRVELTAHNDQDLDYVCIQDVHATCLEPEKLLTEFIYNDKSSYYRSLTDNGVRLYFDRLSKGIFKFSYKLHVTNKGVYSPGIATAECMYSPSFRGNSESGAKIIVLSNN